MVGARLILGNWAKGGGTVASPEFRTTVKKLDCIVANLTPGDFEPYLKDPRSRLQRIFREAGIVEVAIQPRGKLAYPLKQTSARLIIW